jgi:hypothetical protein
MYNNSYTFVLYKYDKGLFDDSIDATYIIYTEGNKLRFKNIISQIKKYKPTKYIYILYNKGWKNSNKSKYITNSAIDLVDCNINIFNHSNENNYNNILILEDDFIFDEKINNYFHINNINNFLNFNKNNPFSFYFGTLPFLFIPYTFNIYKGVINIYTHSIVFSKKYRNEILKYNYETIFCWDVFQNYFNFNKYYYYTPLIYQIVEDTENSKNWPVPEFIRILYLKFNLLLNSQKDPKLLFKLFYLLSYILTILLVLIILFILYYFIKKVHFLK